MTKLLEQTIARLRDLPEDQQNAAAGAVLEYLDDLRDLQLSDEQVAEVRRRRSASGREFLTIEAVRTRLLRPRP
jgi:DTW domain-containing protein YfiP